MGVRMLYVPAVIPGDLPQCEGIRETKYANDTADTDKRCKWSAKYEIDGAKFCIKHAGQAALKKLLAETKE